MYKCFSCEDAPVFSTICLEAYFQKYGFCDGDHSAVLKSSERWRSVAIALLNKELRRSTGGRYRATAIDMGTVHNPARACVYDTHPERDGRENYEVLSDDGGGRHGWARRVDGQYDQFIEPPVEVREAFRIASQRFRWRVEWAHQRSQARRIARHLRK